MVEIDTDCKYLDKEMTCKKDGKYCYGDCIDHITDYMEEQSRTTGMIKLHTVMDEVLYISAKHIVSVRVMQEEEFTAVLDDVYMGNMYRVKESPEEVMRLIQESYQ